MKKIIDTSKVFESNIRLQMIASLYIEDLSYKELKNICNCSDGNMTTHTKRLMKEGFISINKRIIDSKSLTTYSLTELGRRSFEEYKDIIKHTLF